MLAYPQRCHEEDYKNLNANYPIEDYLILSQMNKSIDR